MKKLTKAQIKALVKDYILILLGTFIMSVGYVVFVSPLKLAHVGDPCEPGAGPPADAGHIAHVHPRLPS